MGGLHGFCKMALAGLAALGLWGASLLPAMAGNDTPPVFSPQPVLEFASRSMTEGYTVSVQWYGRLDDGQAAGLLETLRTSFRLEESGSQIILTHTDGAVSLRGAWSRLAGSHEGEAFLRLEADGSNGTELTEAGSRIDGWLRQSGGQGDWSVKAVGSWSGSGAAEPEEALAGLAGTLLAAESLGVYKDQGIVNTLYKTELTGLKAVGSEAAFQTALHRNTETGTWNLAVGAPMLTGEF